MARPKGSKNKRQELKQPLINKALEHFAVAVEKGEQWAVMAVIERQFPKLKAVVPNNSAEHKLIEARVFETYEFKKLLDDLEQRVKDNERKT